jgi:hypothetical protein
MRQRVDVEVHRQVHLAIRPLDVSRQEFGLEVHQLLVSLDSACRDLQAVQIGQVTVTVDVARLPDVPAVGIDKGNIHPELRLRTQGA